MIRCDCNTRFLHKCSEGATEVMTCMHASMPFISVRALLLLLLPVAYPVTEHLLPDGRLIKEGQRVTLESGHTLKEGWTVKDGSIHGYTEEGDVVKGGMVDNTVSGLRRNFDRPKPSWDPLWRINELIHWAGEGHEGGVKFILGRGVPVNSQSDNNETALMYAAMNNNVRMVKLLIKSGAKLEMGNAEGYTALHLAAMEAQDDAVELLLHAGANIEARDSMVHLEH